MVVTDKTDELRLNCGVNRLLWMEGGGPRPKGRTTKGRNGRLAHRVRTLRRAVEMRRSGNDAGGRVGGRVVVSRSARQAVKKARGGKGKGGGGAMGDKREREELVVALAAEVGSDAKVATRFDPCIFSNASGFRQLKE